MIKFIHTADIHIGVENYGKVDQATGLHSRLMDFVRALNTCVDRAITEDVDFFLLCGDAYKTAHPSPTQQKFLMQALFRLRAASIPVVMVIGNHDQPVSFGKAHSLDICHDLPVAGFHVLAKPQTYVLATKNGPVQIVGIPWPTRQSVVLTQAHASTEASAISERIGAAMANYIATAAKRLDKNLPAVLAAHLTVSTGLFSGSERQALCGNDPLIQPAQLAIPPFDYVALGHLHRFQDLNKGSYPSVVYAGSLERIDFGEQEEKGFCLVTIHQKGSTEYMFVPLQTRPFRLIDVRLEAGHDATTQVLAAIAQHNIRDAIVKVRYYIPQGDVDTVHINAVQKACAKASYVAGITPVYAPRAREERTFVSPTMDLETLLRAYFSNHTIAPDRQERLIKIAQKLAEEQN